MIPHLFSVTLVLVLPLALPFRSLGDPIEVRALEDDRSKADHPAFLVIISEVDTSEGLRGCIVAIDREVGELSDAALKIYTNTGELLAEADARFREDPIKEGRVFVGVHLSPKILRNTKMHLVSTAAGATKEYLIHIGTFRPAIRPAKE